MKGKRRWLTFLLVASLASFGMAVSAAADSGSEGEFLAKINATREANGLPALEIDGGLRSHARNHTQDMIDAAEIFHSSESELRAAGGSNWDRIGENVGRGQSTSSLHAAFMDSPAHKQNILGDFNYVGIGTGSSDGYLYVTVVFMKRGSTSPATTEAPSPTTTEASGPGTTEAPSPKTTEPASPQTSEPAAATTSTTTTVPPTTTTTMIVPPDKAITPGQSCIEANRYFQICHD